MFDFSRTFRGVNTDFFFNFSDIFLISPTSDPSDFLLNRAVRAVCTQNNTETYLTPLLPVKYTKSTCMYSKSQDCRIKLNLIFELVSL